MNRLLAACLLMGLVYYSGCAVCCSPYDYAYGYYGGQWQRDDLCNGRVGSIYAPAGSRLGDAGAPAARPSEPAPLPAPAEDKLQAGQSRPALKSVKRTRPSAEYLPVNE